MTIFAIPPLFAGPRLYIILGAVALLAGILLIIFDYRTGKSFRDDIEKVPKQYQDISSIKDLANQSLKQTGRADGTIERFIFRPGFSG